MLRLNETTDKSNLESKAFNAIEWVLDDTLFVVYNLNGQLELYDVAFNQIDLSYMTRYSIPFRSLSEYLNPNIYQPIEVKQGSSISTSHNRLVTIASSKSVLANSLWMCFNYSKGPVGLFRLTLPENFNVVSLTMHYIKNSQYMTSEDRVEEVAKLSASKEYDFPFVSKNLQKAVNLLKTLNWDEEGHVCLACLYKILNFLLSNRVVFSIKTELLAEESFATFYKPKKALLEDTVYQYRYQVSRFARKYFYLLLKNSSLNKAFLLAIDIGAKDLFNDLYYCALNKHESQLAEMCRKRYHEIQSEENHEKVRSELNRSVTTIDDNIKGTYTEFDKYSVSSSEPDSVVSDDNESYTSDLNGELDYLNKADLVQRQKLSKKNIKQSGESRIEQNKAAFAKVFGEEEIENFAQNLMLENYFVNQFNFDSNNN
jgi:hypothetical protein